MRPGKVGCQMVVMSTEIGTLAEIESKMTERSVPRFTTSRSLSAGAFGGDADRHPAVRGPSEVVGVGARGALHVEVALETAMPASAMTAWNEAANLAGPTRTRNRAARSPNRPQSGI